MFFNLKSIKTDNYEDVFYDEASSISWGNYEDSDEIWISKTKSDKILSDEIKTFETKCLNLTDTQITILNMDFFENDYNATEIILKNNNIQLIDVHTFNKFNNSLQHLEITSNNLSTFNIEPIKSLQELNLSNNSLTILNSENFQKLKLTKLKVTSNNLTVVYCLNVSKLIDLSHNNISNICNFSETILEINLSYNNITYIKNYTFKGLKQLNHLDLSHNQIVTLQYDTFDYSTDKLYHLNLNHNMFTELDLLHFKDIHSLISLDLSFNNITTVHQYQRTKFKNINSANRWIFKNFFMSFEKLYLEGNPIKKINMTNLLEICSELDVISISFSEISCSVLQKYISESNGAVLKGPVINEENINGIKCDSSLNTLKNSNPIDSMLILLNKISAILIVLAFFFIVFVIISIIVTVKRYRANTINLR